AAPHVADRAAHGSAEEVAGLDDPRPREQRVLVRRLLVEGACRVVAGRRDERARGDAGGERCRYRNRHAESTHELTVTAASPFDNRVGAGHGGPAAYSATSAPSPRKGPNGSAIFRPAVP